jgi:ribosomal protein L11 methyltransferase
MNKVQPKNVTRVEILVEKGQEELLTDTVYRLAGKGFWLEDQGAYVLLKCYPDELEPFLQNLQASALKIIKVNVELEEQKDYAELTRKYFRPIRIGNISIRAPWNKKRVNGREIIVEPGMAFGTGRHESTRIMIKMMDDVDFKGRTALDMGCGSGILALYAFLLGAREVYAVDNDQDAVVNAQKNVSLNGANAINISCANLRDITGTFGIILANIDIKTFSEYSEKVASLVKKDGVLLVSGILGKDKDQFLRLFPGWNLVQYYRKNSWCGLLLTP